jgi:hypothetical protein
MSEKALIHQVQVLASRLGARLFRNNVSLAWAGNKVLHITKSGQVFVNPGDVVIRRARPIHTGLTEGASDLIGWTVEGLFCACEVKTGRTATTDKQAAFLRAVQSAGGRAGIVHDLAAAEAVIRGDAGGEETSPGGA